MDANYKRLDEALTKASSYINIKPRTELQIRKYLKDKGFTDVVDEAINRLKEYHYIDDFEFACMYLSYGFDKGRGIIRIKRELAEKGVCSETIAMALDELYDRGQVPSQEDAAMTIASQIVDDVDLSLLDYNAKRKLKAKVGRRLLSRGFSTEEALRVINKLF